MRRTLALALAGVLAVGLVGCASEDPGSPNEVEGIVTEMTGDLTNVESFVVLDSDGNSHLLVPQEGLLFYGGSLSHLRDHIASGERVRVTFEVGEHGAMTATLVVHADPDTSHGPVDDHDDDHGHSD